VLTAPVTDESFQPITRRNPKILHITGRVDDLELPQRCALNRPIHTPDVLPLPDPLGAFVAEGPDHPDII